MTDPLSIATGVLGLLGTCVEVGSTLKDFYDGAAIADTKVKGLLTDVESFIQVLRLMKDTFEQEQFQTSFQTTGHIGNHWNNLSASIQDGQNTFLQLQETLEKVNNSVSVLNGARKHLRLKGALDEIGIFQLQIRSYKETLQLSLETVILWNQVTFKESTDKILPNLDELNQAIRRITLDINSRMSSLQDIVKSNPSDTQLPRLNNLRNCVQSAASVVSSALTTVGLENADSFSVTYGSEFGDCFPSEPGETMLRWISSNTVYDYKDDPAIESSSKQRNLTTSKIQSVEESTGSEHSDSDTDLEVEIFQALIKQGKEKFQAKDFGAAERLFRNCLTRISSNVSMSSLHDTRKSKLEIMGLLLDVYLVEKKWDEAQVLLLEKISLGSRDKTSDNGRVPMDILTLVDVLIHKESYAEALLYGRRALKGYRKMGPDGVPGVKSSLMALVRISHMDGNYDEEEAYATILSDFLQLNESKLDLTDASQSNLQCLDSSSLAPDSSAGLQQTTDISDAGQPLGKVIEEDIKVDQGPSILTSSDTKIHVKIVIVGDCSGKTALISVFHKATFPDDFVPTIFEEHFVDIQVDGKHAELALWDTGGDDGYDRLRPLSYIDSHVNLICFAIDSTDSLANVLEKWISEVLHFCPGSPILLVGLKKELRYDPQVIEELRKTGRKPVAWKEGEELRKEIGAVKYLECSARTTEGVVEVFEAATRAGLLAMELKKEKRGMKKKREKTRELLRLFSRPSS